MKEYFRGCYFKCQSPQQTLAVIPAFHKAAGRESGSIQLITDSGSWSVPFPASLCQSGDASIQIGGSRFWAQGLCLDLSAPGLSASGRLDFGPFTPLRYDIMGPFRFVPFMECRHSVWSMLHRVDGRLDINGTPYVFHGGKGYLEGDRGRSFPREYAWTHCFFPGGSLMLSVADIPLGGLRFTGIIGAVLWQGKEYRLATYLGAKAAKLRDGEIVVRQGGLRLTARLLERAGQPLLAPAGGAMTRTIHEQAACRAFYRFDKDGRPLFAFESPQAAFEYEYPR